MSQNSNKTHSEYYNSTSLQEYHDDEIDLREFFVTLWAEKITICAFIVVAALASVAFALLQNDIYRAETTLISAHTTQNTGGFAAQFGGAAALLGVDTGGGNVEISTALSTLQSRQFIGRFIRDNEILVPLFAESWDKVERKIVIDEEVFNPSTGEWLDEKGAPSELEAYRSFSGILTISGPDRDTNIVRVSINWHNPEQAANWINKLVYALNQDIRARDIREAQNAINYLQEQLQSTQLVEMQRVFYQLIESQTRITMLADVREEYVFRVIDPAVVPDRKFAPRRSLIAIVGTMAGGMFGVIFVLTRRLFWKRKSD